MKIKPKREVVDSIIKKQFVRELSLSKYANRSVKGERFFPEREEIPDRLNIRSTYAHDVDRIIHSLAYSRYIDKTQVFYLVENDHITHRVLHVQLVSKIARTIGRFLNLNEDLIEAISLGHDVGHTPFGHNGESIISEFCINNGVGCFVHNVQSFRLFHEIEKSGEGLNLSVQVLDGIICHNGEILNCEYRNNLQKTRVDVLDDYKNGLADKNKSKEMIPMTLEGCVMRISDIIAYIGRDIEDAVKLKLVQWDDVPKDIRNVLGCSNADIINNLIVDIINNSYDAGAIVISKELFCALDELKDWNNKNIYSNPKKMAQDDKIKRMFKETLDKNLDDIIKNRKDEYITIWLNMTMSKSYKRNNAPARIAADFVSGMTDDFIMKSYNERIIPKSFGFTFK